MSDLSFPVGRFEYSGPLSTAERNRLIAEIAAAPAAFRAAVEGLTPKQLDTPYRPGGWTVRQVVHHVPDSHMNAFIRFKLGLTQDQPTINPYDQDRWATLADAADTPIETSLALLEAIHDRWVILMRSLSDEDFARAVNHPEHNSPLTLDKIVALYSWHGRHHTAHVNGLRDRMGWKAKSSKSAPKHRKARPAARKSRKKR